MAIVLIFGNKYF